MQIDSNMEKMKMLRAVFFFFAIKIAYKYPQGAIIVRILAICVITDSDPNCSGVNNLLTIG